MTARAQSFLRALLTAATLWLALALAAPAQTDLLDYGAWDSLAARAEATLDEDRASERALEQLRRDLVAYREQFLTAQGTNQTRIATLQAQVTALGAVPAEGEPPEPEDLSNRRAELTAQLARLLTPQRSAEEAYNRADGL